MIKGVGHPQGEIPRTAPEKGKKSHSTPGEGTRNPGEPERPLTEKVTVGQTPVLEITYSRPAGVEPANYVLLRDLVARTLEEQGATFRITVDGREIGIRDLTPEQARELIADDGYFGVEQTSQRIFDFAVGLAGNDPARLEEILKGVEDGFRQAEKAFGGTLPEISYRTYDAIQDKLQKWSESFQSREG